ILPISERSMRRIMAYRWPGNIRELANAVERATLLADGPEAACWALYSAALPADADYQEWVDF
ncbi:MAG: hypothetical protein H7Y27_08185, partial [Gemmatimonadaceae bacterium]|nr:hypothetical protein [Chitinophagaceae bacterium]